MKREVIIDKNLHGCNQLLEDIGTDRTDFIQQVKWTRRGDECGGHPCGKEDPMEEPLTSHEPSVILKNPPASLNLHEDMATTASDISQLEVPQESIDKWK